MLVAIRSHVHAPQGAPDMQCSQRLRKLVGICPLAKCIVSARKFSGNYIASVPALSLVSMRLRTQEEADEIHHQGQTYLLTMKALFRISCRRGLHPDLLAVRSRGLPWLQRRGEVRWTQLPKNHVPLTNYDYHCATRSIRLLHLAETYWVCLCSLGN